MVNTDLLPVLHRFRDIAFDKSKNRYIWLPLLRLIPRWSGSLHHVIVSDISLKLYSLATFPYVESLGISSTTFMQCVSKSTKLAKITQNNGHYAVQGHSRSPILVPIESAYVTFY